MKGHSTVEFDPLASYYGDDGQSAPAPGDPRRHYYVFCDESGMHGSRHYAFGTLWLPYERRGDFVALVNAVREKYGYEWEIKWQKVGRRSLDFYLALTEEFFRVRWLMYHGLVVRKAYVDKSFHEGSLDLARRKHFTMLLAKKLRRFATPEKRYFIRVDPIASSYEKADEAVHTIANHDVRLALGLRPIDSLKTVDSKETPGVQLCDLFTGAIMDEHEGKSMTDAKRRLKDAIADCLGWTNIRADTHPEEWKFNIWYFRARAESAEREVSTREVDLKFRMPTRLRR